MATYNPPHAIFFDLESALISRGLSLMNFGERFAAHFAQRLGGVTARGVAYGLSEVDGNGFRSHAELASELRDLFPWRARPSEEELIAYWDEVFPLCVAPDPEALPTLRWLHEHGVTLGLVTDGAPEMQRAKIAALGLDGFFAATLIAGEVELEKSDADVYRRSAEALGVSPGAVWMVSALSEDCLAARDAGLGAIFLQRVFYWPREAEPPTREITTLGELVAILGGAAMDEAR
ncbi:MAG TPA: HAD family hydrolase [Ktedonobacterales bacterium]|jgi:FMN phosphatase YigB (HAD superfamily)